MTVRIPVLFLLNIITIAGVILSCTRQDEVKQYFNDHGYNYPVDSRGLEMAGILYSGVDREELLAEGSREFIADGLFFISRYFQKQIGQKELGRTRAIVVSEPVLFRDDRGEVGLMVKVTTYGSGNVSSDRRKDVSLLGADKEIWRSENFAYFSRNELYQWQHGGWIY